MPQVIARARNLSVSAKKMRPLARAIRGKGVEEALTLLRFMPSPWARALAKVVNSAAANAEHNLMLDRTRLKVVNIIVDEGTPLKRIRPMARGRFGRVKKRHSHITVIVDQEG